MVLLTSESIKIYQHLPYFEKFSNFGAKDLCGFWNFDACSAIFSCRSWKMLKNAALDAKIGVDTADILIFWVEPYFDISPIIFWYFGPLPNWNQNVNISTQKSAPSDGWQCSCLKKPQRPHCPYSATSKPIATTIAHMKFFLLCTR